MRKSIVAVATITAVLAVIARNAAAMPVATPDQLGTAGTVEKTVLVCGPWACYWRPGYWGGYRPYPYYYPYRPYPYPYPYWGWRRHYWWGWHRPWWGWHRHW